MDASFNVIENCGRLTHTIYSFLVKDHTFHCPICPLISFHSSSLQRHYVHKVNSKIAASQQRESDEMSQGPMWQQTGGTGVKVSLISERICTHAYTHTHTRIVRTRARTHTHSSCLVQICSYWASVNICIVLHNTLTL